MAFKRSKYRPVNAAKLKERGSRTTNRFDSIFIEGVTPFRAETGTNSIRLVKDPDADYFGEVIWVHSYVGIKNSTYLCLKKMNGKPCPICELADEANRAGDKDERYQLEAKERVIAYVIDRDDEKAGLKVWDMSWTMERDVADACIIKRTKETIDIADPEAGYDLYFQRQGKTKTNTRYSGVQIDRESTPLSDKQRKADEWIGEVQERPLLSLLHYKDAEYLADMLSGKVEEKDEENEEEDDGADRRRDRGSSRRRPARGDPAEREEGEEGTDDEDETEAPTSRRGGRDARDREEPRSSRSSSRRANDRDTEDEDPDDDDSEGEAPSRSTRASRDRDEDTRGSRSSRVNRQQAEEEEELNGTDATTEKAARRKREAEGREEDDSPRGRKKQRDEEEEEEAGEARRWARGRRGAETEEEEEADDERAPRKVSRQRLDDNEEEDDRGRRGREGRGRR